jgi:hypothetical protein
VLRQVPEGTRLSLWIFSHLRKDEPDPHQGDLIVDQPERTITRLRPPARWNPTQADGLIQELDRFRPFLETPLVAAMWKAADSDLKLARGLKTLLVLTDGRDNRLAKDKDLNPGGLDVPTFVSTRFANLGIRVNMVFFAQSPDPVQLKDELRGARQDFAPALSKLDPPGRFFEARNLPELIASLRRGITQNRIISRLTCQILRDGTPVSKEALDVTDVEAEADVWWPRGLEPDTYTLRVEADRTYQQNINLNSGDRVILQLVEGRGGGIAFARVLDDGHGQALAPDAK